MIGTVLDRIADALAGLGTGTTADAILAVAAAGVIAAAVVQLVKELTPARRSYQGMWVARWIRPRATEGAASLAERQLVHLATGGCANAFYELPAEEMALHVNQAGQITLDAPVDYDALLQVLAHGAAPADLQMLVDGPPRGASTQVYFDTRNRVARRIQRNVEGLRLGLGRDWRFWMQLASVLITTIIISWTVAYATGGNGAAVLLSIPVGFVGGYFAPITHDLVVAIQKLRKR